MLRVVGPAGIAILVTMSTLSASAQVKEGQKAPDFGQRDLYDDTPKAEEYWVSDFVGPDPSRGPRKVLLLAFCASHCKPCWEELPELIRLKETYGKEGLEVWSVLIDDEVDGREKGKEKLQSARGKFVTTRVGSQTMPDAYLGKKHELPTLVLVGADGIIALVLPPPKSPADVKKAHARLEEAIRERVAP
ncbi:MAG: TlpA family protein disulfide reductase [Deltaproteobacteria bacterium]|nr:TlpA family protein disulfide reductase [Deltaproteobacteria bacterium]